MATGKRKNENNTDKKNKKEKQLKEEKEEKLVEIVNENENEKQKEGGGEEDNKQVVLQSSDKGNKDENKGEDDYDSDDELDPEKMIVDVSVEVGSKISSLFENIRVKKSINSENLKVIIEESIRDIPSKALRRILFRRIKTIYVNVLDKINSVQTQESREDFAYFSLDSIFKTLSSSTNFSLELKALLSNEIVSDVELETLETLETIEWSKVLKGDNFDEDLKVVQKYFNKIGFTSGGSSLSLLYLMNIVVNAFQPYVDELTENISSNKHKVNPDQLATVLKHFIVSFSMRFGSLKFTEETKKFYNTFITATLSLYSTCILLSENSFSTKDLTPFSYEELLLICENSSESLLEMATQIQWTSMLKKSFKFNKSSFIKILLDIFSIPIFDKGLKTKTLLVKKASVCTVLTHISQLISHSKSVQFKSELNSLCNQEEVKKEITRIYPKIKIEDIVAATVDSVSKMDSVIDGIQDEPEETKEESFVFDTNSSKIKFKQLPVGLAQKLSTELLD